MSGATARRATVDPDRSGRRSTRSLPRHPKRTGRFAEQPLPPSVVRAVGPTTRRRPDTPSPLDLAIRTGCARQSGLPMMDRRAPGAAPCAQRGDRLERMTVVLAAQAVSTVPITLDAQLYRRPIVPYDTSGRPDSMNHRQMNATRDNEALWEERPTAERVVTPAPLCRRDSGGPAYARWTWNVCTTASPRAGALLYGNIRTRRSLARGAGCSSDPASRPPPRIDTSSRAVPAVSGIGCGDGKFLATLRRAGWDVQGRRSARDTSAIANAATASRDHRPLIVRCHAIYSSRPLTCQQSSPAAGEAGEAVREPKGLVHLQVPNAASLRGRCQGKWVGLVFHHTFYFYDSEPCSCSRPIGVQRAGHFRRGIRGTARRARRVWRVRALLSGEAWTDPVVDQLRGRRRHSRPAGKPQHGEWLLRTGLDGIAEAGKRRGRRGPRRGVDSSRRDDLENDPQHPTTTGRFYASGSSATSRSCAASGRGGGDQTGEGSSRWRVTARTFRRPSAIEGARSSLGPKLSWSSPPSISRESRGVQHRVRNVRSVTPLVEPLALDGRTAGLTENAWGERWARFRSAQGRHSRGDIAGVRGGGDEKFLAKSRRWKKPDGLTVIAPERASLSPQTHGGRAMGRRPAPRESPLPERSIESLVDVRAVSDDVSGRRGRSAVGCASWRRGSTTGKWSRTGKPSRRAARIRTRRT